MLHLCPPLFAIADPTTGNLGRLLASALTLGLAAALVATGVGRRLARWQATGPASAHFPQRVHFLVLAILYTLFVAYGAILPLSFEPLSLPDAVDRFQNIRYFQLGVGQERADWVVTILVWVPLGFVWLAALTVDERSVMFILVAAVLTGLGCTALAVGLEFTQLWFPPRTVSQNDILGAVAGALLGVNLWLLAGELGTHGIRLFGSQPWATRWGWLLRTYAVALVVFALLPMDFILRTSELTRKYQAGRVELIPFAAVVRGQAPWYVPLGHFLLWVPVGLLAARVWDQTRPRLLVRRLLAALAAVLGLQLLRLFVFTPTSSTTSVLAGWCGVGFGLGLATVWRTRAVRRGEAVGGRAWAACVWPWLVLAVAFALAAAALACAPWEFADHPQRTGPRFAHFLRIPFAALYPGSKFNALTDVLQKGVLFFPLGFCIARSIVPLSLARSARIMLYLLGLLAAAGVAVEIELLQVFQNVHMVDVTDVLVEAAGAALGMYVAAALGTPRLVVRPRAAALVGASYGLVILGTVASVLGVRAHCGPGREVTSQSPVTHEELTGSRFSAVPNDPYRAPRLVPVALPRIAGGLAIWGATGRDRRGHIWCGVSTTGGSSAPAHLLEYTPETGQVVDRGDPLSALRQCGRYRAGIAQQKIHSRIVQGADGQLYFASMDEQGEDEGGSRLPLWGSHLWRLRLSDYRWEHLLATPEGLIAVAGAGDWVYALGCFGHVLYQFHIPSGTVQSVNVGAVDGHISRNFLCDHRGHAYVPRLERSPDEPQRLTVSLVEFDTDLQEVGERPIRYYTRRSPTDSHGIVAFQYLADRSLVFATDIGFLYRVVPSDAGPAEVQELEWFHPNGEAYVASMFTWDGQRHVMGVSSRDNRYEWLVFDLTRRTARAIPIPAAEPVHRASYLSGSVTRDDQGRCYVVGGGPDGDLETTPDLERALLAVGVSAEDVTRLRSSASGHRPAMWRVEFPSETRDAWEVPQP